MTVLVEEDDHGGRPQWECFTMVSPKFLHSAIVYCFFTPPYVLSFFLPKHLEVPGFGLGVKGFGVGVSDSKLAFRGFAFGVRGFQGSGFRV